MRHVNRCWLESPHLELTGRLTGAKSCTFVTRLDAGELCLTSIRKRIGLKRATDRSELQTVESKLVQQESISGKSPYGLIVIECGVVFPSLCRRCQCLMAEMGKVRIRGVGDAVRLEKESGICIQAGGVVDGCT